MTRAATVPLHLIHDRPFIDLDLVGRGGMVSTARFLVDTGGGGFLLTERLARSLDIAVDSSKVAGEQDGSSFVSVPAPDVLLAGNSLKVRELTDRVFVELGTQPEIGAGGSADGMIGGPVLSHFHVIFDYPNRQFTLAESGAIEPRGMPVTSRIAHTALGFPRVEVEVDGECYGMLLDTGASYTMVSQSLIDSWHMQHPSWPVSAGAVGMANMGYESDANAVMMRLPQVCWNQIEIQNVGVVSRPEGVFEDWMTDLMTAPIVGALAGNVLKQFRIEIDYRSETTSIEPGIEADPRDIDMVGLVLRNQPDSSYSIVGIAEAASRATHEMVHIGDVLLEVNGKSITGLPLAEAVEALFGVPGEERTLLIERDGERLQVIVQVESIICV